MLNKQIKFICRPETAQGIFLLTLRMGVAKEQQERKVPFKVLLKLGKSFRNEITPGNFIFRTREFEQMELQYFVKPGTEVSEHKYWKEFCYNWLG